MREDDHQHNERDHKHDRTDNGDPIQILLDDTRSRLSGIHRACDSIGNTGAFARMHEDKYDQSNS